MVHSMTSFSRSTGQLAHLSYTIDIRTVNSKSMEIHTKLPFYLREIETKIKTLVGQQLKRGKIEVFFDIDKSNTHEEIRFNQPLIQQYFEQFKAITPSLTDEKLWPMVYKLPGVIEESSLDASENEALYTACLETIQQGIDQLIIQREREGKAVKKVFAENIDLIATQLVAVIEKTNGRPEQIRERLQNKVDALVSENLDANRLEQEIIYYVERFDINEETTRLEEHLRYFTEVLEDNSAFVKGKKLGFIAQEIGREINTIGSKVNDSQVQRKVILMKEALERIKEQVLNIA